MNANRSRFLRVAPRRTQDVLNALYLLGKCSNRQIYSYTQEEVDRIFETIDKAFNATKASMRGESFRFEDFGQGHEPETCQCLWCDPPNDAK